MTEPLGTAAISLVKKVLSGLGGGLLGTAGALLISTFLQFANESTVSLSSAEFTGVNMVIIVFMAAFIGNLSSLLFIILSNKKKYRAKKQIFEGAFFVNIFLFLVGLPFYLFLPQGSFIVTIAGIHIFLSACSTILFAEIFSGVKYAVSGVVGVSVAQMIFLMSYIGLGNTQNAIAVVFFLPFIWMMLPVFLFISEQVSFRFMEQLEG